MSLRGLLRLDDKVAAEGRRLDLLGGPSMSWVAVSALLGATLLHGVLLLVPTGHRRIDPPGPSLTTDFPIVWRPATEPPPAAAPAVAEVTPPTPRTVLPMARPTLVKQPERGPVSLEPIAEPVPDTALTRVRVDVDAVIPAPDPPPDAGPSLAQAAEVAIVPMSRVSPIYPLAARSIGAEGDVRIQLALRADGTVEKATIESCSRPGLGFEAAALNAVKRWRYEPEAGGSDPRRTVVTIRFQRQDDTP